MKKRVEVERGRRRRWEEEGESGRGKDRGWGREDRGRREGTVDRLAGTGDGEVDTG